MQSQPTRPQKLFSSLLELTLAANLAFAFVGALLAHIANNESRQMMPRNTVSDDSTYIFNRAIFRISDLLHLPSSNPVTTSTVARNFDHSGKLIFAAEVCIVIVTLAVAVLLLPFQQKLLAVLRNRGLATWYAGITALFAVPVLNLAVMIHDKGSYDPHGLAITAPDRIHFFTLVFIGELIGVAILIVANQWRALSLSVLSLLSLLHCAFWIWAFRPRFATYFGDPKSPSVLLFFFPIATLAWLFFLASQRSHHATDSRSPYRKSLSLRLSALAASFSLVLLFAPNVFATFPIAKSPASQAVEISRGPCFGSCPVYTIRVHGNGLVEYSYWWTRRGLLRDPRWDTQTRFISQAQFDLIMDIVRSTQLQRLDQRAFDGCSDTPSFSLAVITDQETIRVTGDADCVGSRSGVQADVVTAITAIEKIVGYGKGAERIPD
jgi:hypothetical protein